MLRFFKWIATQVEEQRHAEFGEGLAPDFEGLAAVFEEDGLPGIVAHGNYLAVVIHIHEVMARGLRGFPADIVELVGPIEVVLVVAAVEINAFFQLFHDLEVTTGGGEGGQPVFVGNDAVADRASRKVAGPFDETGHAIGTLPVRVLLAAEWRCAGVRPGVVVRAVVGGVLDDGIVRDAEVINELEQFAHLQVVLDHAVGVFVIALVAMLGLDVGAEVHAGAVPPAEERFALLVHASDEILGGGDGFLINGLHALLGQRTGVLDGLAALAVGLAMEHTARTERLAKGFAVGQLHVAGVVLVFRFLLGIEVIEVAEEFIEAVHGRQVFVAVALVVLAELSGGVAEALHDGGHGDVGFLPAFRRTREADLGHASADGNGAVDEGGAAGGAALLAVVIGEENALLADAINVRRLVTHHAAVVVADVLGADVVAPDDQDVGFLARGKRWAGDECQSDNDYS